MCFDRHVQYWDVRRPIKSIHDLKNYDRVMIGMRSPHGIIPLERVTHDPSMEIPFREAEYLVAGHQLSVGSLSALHHLVELRVDDKQHILPTPLFHNWSLFHTLKVLEAKRINPSFLAGQTFHKLEKCRLSFHGGGRKLRRAQVTHMPVCTTLDVDNLTLLATLKLPQIRKLGASFDHPEFSTIWGTHIAANANLSGLELLHVHGWYQQADLIQVLRCLRVLKSLILANGSDLDAAFFGEFILMHSNETAVLMHSYDERQISPVVCPMLRSLLIEGCSSPDSVKLIPVLKQVVTFRAVCGSPLKRFTLSSIELGTKLELIGSQGGFVAEIGPMDEDAKPFGLDI